MERRGDVEKSRRVETVKRMERPLTAEVKETSASKKFVVVSGMLSLRITCP